MQTSNTEATFPLLFPEKILIPLDPFMPLHLSTPPRGTEKCEGCTGGCYAQSVNSRTLSFLFSLFPCSDCSPPQADMWISVSLQSFSFSSLPHLEPLTTNTSTSTCNTKYQGHGQCFLKKPRQNGGQLWVEQKANSVMNRSYLKIVLEICISAL